MGQTFKRQRADGCADCAGRAATHGGVTLRAAYAAISAAALVMLAAPVFAQDAEEITRGEALLTKNCAMCHAIGKTGDSPRADAPLFRTLGQKYPVEALEEALGEGLVSGHPDMPEFRFEAADVGAIIAYLQSIQQR